MRKDKTVTITAETLAQAQARYARAASAEGMDEKKVAAFVATAVAAKVGRDEGKQYLLTEMDVFKAEKWAARAMIALNRGDTALSLASGMAGLAEMLTGGIANLSWPEVEPLLDEMMGCVQFVAPSGPRKLLPGVGDIEEIGTLMTLRKEILGLHFDFFAPAEP